MEVVSLPEVSSGITFDSDSHTYKLDGVKIPGVTDILETLNLGPDYSFVRQHRKDQFDKAAEMGSAIHYACQLAWEDRLDYDECDPNIANAAREFLRLCSDVGLEPLLFEELVFSRRYRFGGTLDVLGRIGNEYAIVDIKTGVPAQMKSAALQTAGYAVAAVECGLVRAVHKRYTFYLDKSGKPGKSKPHDDQKETALFLSAVSLYHWKTQKG